MRREEKEIDLGNRVGLLSDVNSLLEASSCEFYLPMPPFSLVRTVNKELTFLSLYNYLRTK